MGMLLLLHNFFFFREQKTFFSSFKAHPYEHIDKTCEEKIYAHLRYDYKNRSRLRKSRWWGRVASLPFLLLLLLSSPSYVRCYCCRKDIYTFNKQEKRLMKFLFRRHCRIGMGGDGGGGGIFYVCEEMRWCINKLNWCEGGKNRIRLESKHNASNTVGVNLSPILSSYFSSNSNWDKVVTMIPFKPLPIRSKHL